MLEEIIEQKIAQKMMGEKNIKEQALREELKKE